ncbi:hypothetical protein [Parafrankia sp. FMc2]|uniref:hypothetical protein n=1 Tax=Parafrankia sp. FMc2 TaxID=3233196 RepID=UPI0034D50F36
MTGDVCAFGRCLDPPARVVVAVPGRTHLSALVGTAAFEPVEMCAEHADEAVDHLGFAVVDTISTGLSSPL